MTNPARQTTWPPPRGARRLLWLIATLWFPVATLAQGSACDQLKATLAARIEATGVRGYSLEAVPAATKVPAGAKAIGNCEGGALKILYRRWGGASAPASAVVAPEVPAKRPPPVARAEVPAPTPSVPAPKPTPAPVLAPASLVKAEAVEPPPVRASEVRVTGMVESVASQARPLEPAEEKPPLPQRASGFVATHWRWLLALLVPLAALGWFWRAHHLAYDKNGLPRGPRL